MNGCISAHTTASTPASRRARSLELGQRLSTSSTMRASATIPSAANTAPPNPDARRTPAATTPISIDDHRRGTLPRAVSSMTTPKVERNEPPNGMCQVLIIPPTVISITPHSAAIRPRSAISLLVKRACRRSPAGSPRVTCPSESMPRSSASQVCCASRAGRRRSSRVWCEKSASDTTGEPATPQQRVDQRRFARRSRARRAP